MMAKLTIRFESHCLDVVSIYDIKDQDQLIRELNPMLERVGRLYGPLFGLGFGGPRMHNMPGPAVAGPPEEGAEGEPCHHHRYRFSHMEGADPLLQREIWVCSNENCDAMLSIEGRLDLESARDVQEVNQDGRQNQDLEDGQGNGGQDGGDNARGTTGGDRPRETDSGQGQPGEDRSGDRRDGGGGGGPASERRISEGYISPESEMWCHKCRKIYAECECDAAPEHQSVEALREGDGEDPDQQAQDEQADTDSGL
ncbi:hypothetical protein KAR91_28530 [Candidatus Pacearchaeota archaeon]|nr:hypothetical protein [Candidatus Pacearchaeota archaeon]